MPQIVITFANGKQICRPYSALGWKSWFRLMMQIDLVESIWLRYPEHNAEGQMVF
ncbi:hypothetical protein R84865_002240 [Carnimonas sp. R-84865]